MKSIPTRSRMFARDSPAMLPPMIMTLHEYFVIAILLILLEGAGVCWQWLRGESLGIDWGSLNALLTNST